MSEKVKLPCGCIMGNEKYSDKHDAYYCTKCNEWLDDLCDDNKCEFCKGRKPFPKELHK